MGREMPELRQDPLSGRWVVIATGRAKRPEAFVPAERPVPLAAHDPDCPFCPGNEAQTPPEVLAVRDTGTHPDSPGWQLRVVTNKYAAFDAGDGLAPSAAPLEGRRAAQGRAEVIIETPYHDRSLSKASAAERLRMLQAYLARYRQLSGWPDVGYVMLFRNQGARAGASQIHPHSQIMAMPLVPPAVADELARSASYLAEHGRCLLCDVIARERADGRRILYDDGRFLIIAPYASRTPCELMILPATHQADLAQLSDTDAAGLAAALGIALGMLDRALGDPPYNYYLHGSPPHDPLGEWQASYHWHVSILPRLTQQAGFELGSGVLVNITLPEAAAAFLRAHL
jgi:UDPglucose--hexose-1-phosphate uridylyltransferase